MVISVKPIAAISNIIPDSLRHQMHLESSSCTLPFIANIGKESKHRHLSLQISCW